MLSNLLLKYQVMEQALWGWTISSLLTLFCEVSERNMDYAFKC